MNEINSPIKSAERSNPVGDSGISLFNNRYQLSMTVYSTSDIFPAIRRVSVKINLALINDIYGNICKTTHKVRITR